MEETDFVKQKIVTKSIELLKADGLKFSIDRVCENLKISKKTIYKYFGAKEELAQEIYRQVFGRLLSEAENLSKTEKADKSDIAAMLFVLKEALYFSDDSVLNRYSLSLNIKRYAENELQVLFVKLIELFGKSNYKRVAEYACFTEVVSASLKSFCVKSDGDDLTAAFAKMLIGE